MSHSSRQRERHQVGVGRAVGVGLDLADRLVDPRPLDPRAAVEVGPRRRTSQVSALSSAVLDHAGRRADRDRVRGQVAGHHRVRADDRAVADHHPAATVTLVPSQTSLPIRTRDLTMPWSLIGRSGSA